MEVIHISDQNRPGKLSRQHNTAVRSSLSGYQGQENSSLLCVKHVLEGQERYHVNGQDITIPAGHFMLFNQGLSYSVDFQSDENVEGLCLYLDTDFFDKAAASFEHRFDLDYQEKEFIKSSELNITQEITDLNETSISRVIQAMLKTDDLDSIDKTTFFYDLAIELIAFRANQIGRLKPLGLKKSSTKKELLSRLRLAKNYLITNCETDISLNELARISALSHFHLMRTFKSYYGISPRKMLEEYKFKRAILLISKGTYSVSEVAYKIGYANLPAFSKAFHRRFKCYPREWLKRNI